MTEIESALALARARAEDAVGDLVKAALACGREDAERAAASEAGYAGPTVGVDAGAAIVALLAEKWIDACNIPTAPGSIAFLIILPNGGGLGGTSLYYRGPDTRVPVLLYTLREIPRQGWGLIEGAMRTGGHGFLRCDDASARESAEAWAARVARPIG